jgi:catechol 2,3-dioxygenase-like lactoylglutathione lyase family enzyme
MIVGVDHLALSCKDVDVAGPILQRSGYRAAFVERALPNASVKEPLVHAFHPAHAIAYYDLPEGTPLELTNYGGPVVSRPSRYHALVDAPPAGATPVDDESWTSIWKAVGCDDPSAFAWPGLNATVWSGADAAGAPSVRMVLCPVDDVERAASFWETALNARIEARGTADDGSRWVRVKFAAPVKRWRLDVVLAEGDVPKESKLDDAGFPCLALLCTSLARDTQRLARAGATTTGTFDVGVNGRDLAVAFFRGPDGELLELIEVRKDAS